MKTKVVLLSAVVLSLVLVMLPLASSCAPAKPKAVEKFVTMLDITDITGPAGTVCYPHTIGLEDNFKRINEEGGVDGVKIKLISVDCRYDVARGVSAYKRYRTEPKLVFVGVDITGTTLALLEYFEKDKMCAFSPGGGIFAGRPGRVFIVFSTYQDAFAAYMEKAVSDWKAKGLSGAPNFAYISADNPAGREGLHGSLEYAQEKGYKIVATEFAPVGTMDFTPFLLRLKEKGANRIFIGDWFDPSPAMIVRDARKLGFTQDMQFCADVWGFTKPALKTFGEHLEGMMVCSPYLRGVEADKSYAVEVWTSSGRGSLEEMSELYLVGVISSVRLRETLRLALKEVGYEKVNGEAIFEASKRITGFVPKGLAGPTTWSEKERRGSRTVKFYQVKDGKTVPLTDWVETPDAVALYKW